MEHSEDPMDFLDEGWWASVLSEVDDIFGRDTKQSETESDGKLDWSLAQHLFSQEEVIELPVVGYNKGGLLVGDKQVQGFVPLSHLVDCPQEEDEDAREAFLASFQGTRLCLKIIECDPAQERIVLSERAAQAGPGCRKQLLDSLNPGDCVEGRVTNVTDFGAFVDLGGLEGLIHVSELSWGRVRHPSEIVEVGQQISVCVMEVDRERGRVPLSRKRLLPNPWEDADQLYQPGMLTEAVITSLVSFGAFAQLKTGIEGLIHTSQMELQPGARPGDVLQEGQRVLVEVLNVEPERHRLGLRLHKQLSVPQSLEPANVSNGQEQTAPTG
jgi:small subunit ribosomal protein S1